MGERLNRIIEGYKITKDGIVYDKDGNVVDTFINPCGYISAKLDGYIITVAYIVAILYVDNPNEYMCVSYKDGNYNNIKSDNLYWYGDVETCKPNKSRRKIIAIDSDGNTIGIYNSVSSAARELGLSYNTIVSAARRGTPMKDKISIRYYVD